LRKKRLVVAIIVLAVLVLSGVLYVYTRDKKITTDSGLTYEDVKVGNGESPKLGQTVQVHYVGRLKDEDGKEFNNFKTGTPIEFNVGDVVKGWQEGLQSMKVGGTRKLWIPSKLGYGSRGQPPSIPPNSDLYFEIELLGIK
jgi:peptidylprolyl isomerase